MEIDYLGNKTNSDARKELARDYFSTRSSKLAEFTNKKAGEWAVTADWLYSHANDIYYNTKDYTGGETNDPREMVSRKFFIDGVRKDLPNLSEEWLERNYRNVVKDATGNDLGATGLFEVFGQKISEGYKSFAAGVASIVFEIENMLNSNSSDDYDDQKRKERQDKFLSSISGKVRTDYYNEYDNFVQKAILGLGDTLPSLLNSAPAIIGATAYGFTGNPLFMQVGKGISDVLNFTMEYGSLVQSLRNSGATPEQILLAGAAYATVSTAIEHNFDRIPEEMLARPIGQWLKLYRGNGGLGPKVIADSVSKVIGRRLLTAGVDWLSETGEEMLQQLAEDWTYNLLDEYRREHGQEKLPDWLTATPEEMWQDFIETGKQMGTTQTLLSVGEALLGLGFDVNFGNIKAIVNSNRYTNKTNRSRALFTSSMMGTNGNVSLPQMQSLDRNGNPVLDKDGNAVMVEGKFNPVEGKETSIGFIADTKEDADRIGFVKGKQKRLSSMQVVDTDIFTEGKKADATDAAIAIEDMVTKDSNGKPINISSSEDGKIIVDDKNIGTVVRNFIASNYSTYQGIKETSSDGNKSFLVTVGGKTYTFTTDSNNVSSTVTSQSILNRVREDKGVDVSNLENFRKDVNSIFSRSGMTAEQATKATDDIIEMAESWRGTSDNLVSQIIKKLPNMKDSAGLSDSISYGSAAMVAKFVKVLGFDTDWAKSHIVLDEELASGVDKKGNKYAGTSYWTEGNSTEKIKNYSQIKDKANAVFHIAVSPLVDQTTGIHEIGHMALSMGEQQFIKDDYFKTAFYDQLKEDNKGIEDETKWVIGDATQEAFAEKLEAYIDTGVAENKEQASLFRRILDAVKAFYDRIKNHLSDDQLEFYDRLFDETNREENISENLANSSENEENISGNEDYSTDSVERRKRVREVDSINEDLRAGRIVNFNELKRYRLESDLVTAEYVASSIAVDGKLQWMSTLLENIIFDYMEGSNFTWDDITDEDWQKIAKNFTAQANQKLASTNKRSSKTVSDYFDGKDVAKVLMRLYAWDLNTTESARVRNWLNKYTGRNSQANDQNILDLARRLKDRGEFDYDKVKLANGKVVSKKWKFLDLVQQSAYGKDQNKNYRTSRVTDAYWQGAKEEIENNVRELMEIEQTVAPLRGAKVEQDELTDISPKYQNITERDVRKARQQAANAAAERDEANRQLREIQAENDSLNNEMQSYSAAIRSAAEQFGINPDDYETIQELVDVVSATAKESDELAEFINSENVRLALSYEQKLQENQDKINELKWQARRSSYDNNQLEIRNRQKTRQITRLSKQVKELTEELSKTKSYLNEEKRYSEYAERIDAQNRRKIDKLNARIVKLGMEHDAVVDDLREAWRMLQNLENSRNSAREKLSSTLQELSAAVSMKERLQRELWERNEKVQALQEYIKMDRTKRNLKSKLTRKSGDATTDKALAQFSKFFFQTVKKDETFKPLDIMKYEELYNAISHDGVLTNWKGEKYSVKNLFDVLKDKGFIVDGVLVKGFEDLKLKDYKQVSDAVTVARQSSNYEQSKREEARQEIVGKISGRLAATISNPVLNKKESEQAHERYMNGEFKTEDEARAVVWAEKTKYWHEGTTSQKNRKGKMGFNVRRGFNPNNNVAFNSFTSLYNLLGSVSKELRDQFFFGTSDMEGINQVTDRYIKARDERKDSVKKAILDVVGDEKSYDQFIRDSQKKVTTKQLNFGDASMAPYWLKDMQAFLNFAQNDTFDENFIDNELTLEEVMAIYEHSKQNEDIAHILNGRTNINAYQMAWIVDQFEREDGVFHKYKDIADAYQKGYEKSWPSFSKVANDVYGIPLTRYDFYSPANTASDEKDTDISIRYGFDSNGNPIQRGRRLGFNERSDMKEKMGGANPISLSYVSDFGRIIDGQEWFIAGAEFFKTWNDIMKNDGGAVRQMIQDRYGSNVADTIIKLMRSTAYSEFSDIATGLNNVVNKIRNHMALANLGFSLSSTLQQPFVMFLGAHKFGYRNIAKAFGNISAHGGLRNFIEYVHDMAPQIKANSDLSLMYAKQAVSDSKFLKAIGLGQKIAEIGMYGIEKLDQITRCVMWEAGYQSYLDKGLSEDEAKIRATQDTMNTNSSRQAKDNSLAYNTKSPFWKALLMFTNQLNKQWNMLIGEDGIEALLEHRVKDFVGTVLGLALASTGVLLAKGKLLNNGDKDDEDWWKDLLKDYSMETIEMVPVLGDMISEAVYGYSYVDSNVVTATINFAKAIASDEAKSTKKERKIITTAKDMVVDAMTLVGAPKNIVKNTYNSLFESGKYVGDDFFNGRGWKMILPRDWYEFLMEER